MVTVEECRYKRVSASDWAAKAATAPNTRGTHPGVPVGKRKLPRYSARTAFRREVCPFPTRIMGTSEQNVTSVLAIPADITTPTVWLSDEIYLERHLSNQAYTDGDIQYRLSSIGTLA